MVKKNAALLLVLILPLRAINSPTHTAVTEDEYLQLAKEYCARGDNEKAAAWYKYLLEINPNNTVAQQALISLSNHQHTDLQKTISPEQKNKTINNSSEAALVKQSISPTNKPIKRDIQTLYSQAYDDYTNGKEEEAISCYKEILALNPNIPAVLYNTAILLKNRGEFTAALPYYNRLLEIEPTHSDALQGRSHALLALGKYDQAWQDFEHRWTKPRTDAKNFTTYMHTHNNDLTGKTVLLKSEFGFGDTLQFIRYAALVKSCGAHVIAAVQKQLIPLLSYCPYLESVIPVDSPAPKHDLETVLMSLPWAFKTTLTTIPNKTPYLFADDKLTDFWRKKLTKDTNFKIGICWHGNAYTTEQLKKLVDTKSIPLKLLAPLSTFEHVSIYSLQKTSGLDELSRLPASFVIHQLGPDFDESHGAFMDTAAVIKNLDLVITIDTSIAHLAGGLGIPTWLMLPYASDWRWLVDRTDSPWYPCMRLFRQKTLGDWDSVMARIITELKKQAHQKKAAATKQDSPADINTLFGKGIQLVEQGKVAEALTTFISIDQQHPSCVPVLYNIAGCHRRLGALEDAADYYNKTLTIDPKHTDAAFGLALVRHTQGDMKQGWELFNLWRKDIDTLPKNPTLLVGKKVLIKAEWGLGDMINFIRYAQNLHELSAHVVVQCHKPLVKLLSRCPYINTIIQLGTPLPETDFQLPLLYLPTLFHSTELTVPNTVPYLYPNPQLVAQWRDKLAQDTAFKVGICWDMGHHDTNLAGWKRAIPLDNWHPLLRTKNVNFYCLQKEQLNQLNSLPTDITVHQFGPDFDTKNGSFMDSAAVMKNLDLVITVDTAIAHLAGALGVPVWVMLPYHTDYRWMRDRTDTPWYPTMKLFRSTTPDDWQPVIEQVTKELKTYSKKYMVWKK